MVEKMLKPIGTPFSTPSVTADVFARGQTETLIALLSKSATYPHPAPDLRVIQTHISVVFLAGEYAYKMKKPLDLGFLNYSTKNLRREACFLEVALNKRLAESVYIGVVPIVRKNSRWMVGGESVSESESALERNQDVAEYLVKMKRLPEDRAFDRMLKDALLRPVHLVRLAKLLAEFYAGQEPSEKVQNFGRFKAVEYNAIENFDQLWPAFAFLIPERLIDEVRRSSMSELSRHHSLIEERCNARLMRDTHGDLRLEHVYYLPDWNAEKPLCVIDCIEFNRRFRYADPVADVAFLAMDLEFRHRTELAELFVGEFLEAAKDHAGRELIPYYVAYRAIVRAKVEAFRTQDPDLPRSDRQRSARLVLDYLEFAKNRLREDR